MNLDGDITSALANRYAIERRLGEGGMAVVYLARDLKHLRRVAVKVLRPELANSLGADRFLQEIAIAGPLMHPNILALFDSGEASGLLYYVMPFVEGPTLRERLTREVQLPIDEAIVIARQVAAALDYAHSRGVVHRDIKPDNILLFGDHVLVADFGLAKAVSMARSVPLTAKGIAVGTPPYMSPEQCNAGGVIDARSDIYSLACVVFEMIAGVTPFRGATVQSTIVQHLTSNPPSLLTERRSCPTEIDTAVQRALAKIPADRFRTAGEFVRALESRDAVQLPPDVGLRHRIAPRWLVAGVGAVFVAGLAWLALDPPRPGHQAKIAADTTKLVILPLAGAVATSGTEDELLYEAFARWPDMHLTEQFLIADAIRRHGSITSVDDARAVALSLGAGRYVRGQVVAMGNGLSVRAALYDVARNEALYHAVERVSAGGIDSGVTSGYQRLADALLLRGLEGDAPPSSANRRSLAAVQAMATAQRALDAWDLPRAESSLEAAVGFDTGYARAHLWLAQVRVWQRQSIPRWREEAREAHAGQSALGAHDALLAVAVEHLAAARFDAACATYDSLRALNTQDFTAWYGLGICRTLDRTVVADSSSPSGWRFRSNYGRGLAAYARALELLPSAHGALQGDAFQALRTLLLTDRDRLVAGAALAPDSTKFLARLAWMDDTLALIPYPAKRITSGERLYPPGFEQALAHQREMFRQILESWSVVIPLGAAAKEAMALSLEILSDPSAADQLAEARRLATDPARRIQLGATEVFVRLKFAIPQETPNLTAARALADSLLSGDSVPTSETARWLAPIAELVGRCDHAVALARRAARAESQPVTIPQHARADGAELLIRAALGCRSRQGSPTLMGLLANVQHDAVYGGADSRLLVEHILLVPAAQLSFPAEAEAISRLSNTWVLLFAMHAALRGDLARARDTLSGIMRSHGDRPAMIDAAYPEARLWLTLGDTARALDLLRRSLAAIATYDHRTLSAVGVPGALVRAMVLTAELERTRGNQGRGRSLSRVVAELWSDADRALQPVVRSMQVQARS